MICLIDWSIQMRQFAALLLGPMIVFSASAALVARGQSAGGRSQATSSEMVNVGPIRKLRKGVDAWPIIGRPDNSATRQINETLAQLNLRLAQSLRECDSDLKTMEDGQNKKNSVQGDWSRKVKVTMEGPRFLSLVAIDEFVFCGGAHPDRDTMALLFDIASGTLLDWTSLVARSAGPLKGSDTVSDGSTVEALVLPALQKMNFAVHEGDCKDAIVQPKSFLIWPDAKQGRLVVYPFDLPHVIQVCAKGIELTMNQARELGFDEGLLDAIARAHYQIAIKTKP
jgi:hypothetical protein